MAGLFEKESEDIKKIKRESTDIDPEGTKKISKGLGEYAESLKGPKELSDDYHYSSKTRHWEHR